ncbi:MAG: MliC family protein [Vulcanococcus sp.]
MAYTPTGADLAIGDQHIALTGSGARYTAPGVELWEHQGTTRIDWLGQVISCR